MEQSVSMPPKQDALNWGYRRRIEGICHRSRTQESPNLGAAKAGQCRHSGVVNLASATRRERRCERDEHATRNFVKPFWRHSGRHE
jgi:hypothetical protein